MHAQPLRPAARLLPAQLEKTFVLNFGKKGELKDEIKEIKAEIKAQKKLLEKAEQVEEMPTPPLPLT